MANSSDNNLAPEEHKTRQLETQQKRTHEHDDTTYVKGNDNDTLSRNLLSDSRIEATANSSLRTASIQTMQQTHGNRAMQRFIQRSGEASSPTTQSRSTPRISVQREWNQAVADKQMRKSTSAIYNNAGDFNAIEAIPVLGNVASLMDGIVDLGAAGLSSLEGKDKMASNEASDAGYNFLHAVPFLGNYLAGRDASRDFDKADETLASNNGILNAPPIETSEDRFRNTGVWDYITGN